MDGSVLPGAPAVTTDRLFAAMVDMARLGLALDRKCGRGDYRRLVGRLCNSLFNDPERRGQAIALTALMEIDERSAIDPGAATRELHSRRCGVLLRLHEAGRISELAMMAAFEIQDIAAEGVSSGALSVLDYSADRVDVSVRDYLWPPGGCDSAARLRRFDMWRRDAGVAPVFGPVIEVIVLGSSIRSLERKHSLRNGVLPGLLKEALDAYVRLAGWTRMGMLGVDAA